MKWVRRLLSFSPLENESVPQCDGLILGGGYPELYADILEKNTGTLNVKECVESRYRAQECGGFMYLHEIMEDSDKKRITQYGRHNQRKVQKNRLFATLRIYGNARKQR